MKKTRPKKEKLNPIEKMLKSHLPMCKMHEHSLMDKRFCSCGRDNAVRLISNMVEFLKMLEEWMENHDSLASNSMAHRDLDNILAELK